jgi:phosphotransferase system HPr (HPr) family protein
VPERTVTVGPEEGLHARPAARFVKAAKGFAAEIVVIKADREANAKSQLAVMKLGARHGDEIVIRAEGEDAPAALDELAAIATTP